MRTARTAFLLFLLLTPVLSSGCLAQTYPGVVVGNPDTDDPPTPGKPGETDPGEYPDPSQGPTPSEPPSTNGDPAAPGPIQKDPEEIQANEDDAEVPGGDRVGEDPDEESPPDAARPEHAESGQLPPDAVMAH